MQSLPHDLFFAYFAEFVPLELALLARASKEWHAALMPLLQKCKERDCRIVATPCTHINHFQMGSHPRPRFWPERNPLPELPRGAFGFKRCGEPAWFYQGIIADHDGYVIVFYANENGYYDRLFEYVPLPVGVSPRDALYERIKSL